MLVMLSRFARLRIALSEVKGLTANSAKDLSSSFVMLEQMLLPLSRISMTSSIFFTLSQPWPPRVV
jgi:hypothetical protein